jgi:hypothetical protein
LKENPMKNRRVSALSMASALSIAALAFTPSASAQQTRGWDPFKTSGLEGGGWTHPFRMPQQNVPTHWDVTNWPRSPHPSQTVGLPPVVGPIHGMVPSGIGTHHGLPPGMPVGNHGLPPGMPVGNHGLPPGMPVGIPSNVGPTDISIPVTVDNTTVSDSLTIVNPVIGAVPDGMTDLGVAPSGPVVAPVVTVPPSQNDQSQPAIDDVGPAAPDIAVPDGMLGVVVVNQTARTVKVLTKFVDPQSGRWIARWNDPVAPGQAVRLGVTTVGTFFMRADMTDANGAVVPVLDGSDAVFNGPNGAMGLRRAIVTRQGTDLVATINE